MITRPLDLKSQLKEPSSRLNPLPLLDILFIALFFSLLGSSFVLSPGLTIDLPRTETGSLAGLPATAVLTVHSDKVLLFQERILSPDTLRPALEEHVERRGETNLLVYFHREVSVQTLLSISELARAAGVARVQLAAEPGHLDPDADNVFR